MYILFEHASGYALFVVKQFEELSSQMPAVERSVLDFGKFGSLVHLHAFSPFTSSEMSLEECIAISEGSLSPALFNFLESNIRQKKKQRMLGVGDVKLGQAISARLPWIKCIHLDVVPELLRGIRFHIGKYLTKMDSKNEHNAQLGLGHSFARTTVKFNVNRADNMIMQAIALIDQIDKNINSFVMRIREWYSCHFPELCKLVKDMYQYCQCTEYISERCTFTEDKVAGLAEILGDEVKAWAIYEASNNSIGMDISALDLVNVNRFCVRVMNLMNYRQSTLAYLKNRMQCCAPNLNALIGEQVGARLISRAGSLNNLAKSPASTIQILGAEKALFRALRKRCNTPKYGLIFHSSFISKAASKYKGRISRFVANKCALASRIDCFSEVPVSVYGEHLKAQVEERLELFESGVVPRKNVDVMREAIVEAKEQEKVVLKKIEKAKRKALRALKNAQAEQEANAETADGDFEATIGEEPPTKKKKKKKQKEDSYGTSEVDVSAADLDTDPPKKKKKKKRHGLDVTV